MKTRKLTLLFTALVVLLMIAALALPASALTEGDFEYELINGGKEVRVTKYIGPGGNAYIPNKIGGKPVTEIGDRAFTNDAKAVYVWIGSNVRKIGNQAFYDNKNLKNIDIEEGLSSIGYQAFTGASALQSIKLPDSLTEISDRFSGCFQGCGALKKATLGKGLKGIVNSMFEGCAALETVEIPEGVETIGSRAFWDCKALRSIALPDSMRDVGTNAFYRCSALTNVDLGKGVERIRGGAFSYCASLKSIDIPDSVTSLQYYDNEGGNFMGCSALESVKIGSGLKLIPIQAFQDCPAVKTVTLGKNVEQIGDYAFFRDCSLKGISLPDKLVSIGTSAFADCSALAYIEFGAGLRTMSVDTFGDCVSLTSLVLPDSLEYLSGDHYAYDGAFHGCTKIKTVKTGRGLREISNGDFAGCTSLESITLNDGIEKIGECAFLSNTSLKSITIPDSVQSIGYHAFENCSALRTVRFGGGLRQIGENAFLKCTALTEVVLPDALEEFVGMTYYQNDSYAFNWCSGLKKVTFGEGPKVIKTSVFANCESIETIVFGPKTEIILEYAISTVKANPFKKAYFLGDCPREISDNNPALFGATWYHLAGASGFTGGKTASPVYTVNVDANGGEFLLPGDERVASYQKKSVLGRTGIPRIPVREGHTFLGWYLNKEGTGSKIDFNTYTVKGDVTVYAKWKVNSYRIFFDPRGGSVSVGGKTVTYGEPIGTLPTPKLTGDTFLGWYPGMNGSGPKYTETTKMPAQDTVLYAAWKKNDSALTVIFDTHGGSFISPVNAISGKPISRPADPVKDGCMLVGWYKDPGCRESYDFDNEKVTANVTLHALWAPLFRDVPLGKWFTSAVDYCSRNGYMSGTGDRVFSPDATLTRAMFVTILAKIDKADTSAYTGTSFTDVKTGKWYSKPIEWAFRNGYTSGTGNGLFGVNSPVTREQLAVFLYNYSQKKGYDVSALADISGFTDAGRVSGWAKTGVRWAIAANMISGTSKTTLSPKQAATRAQVALIVMNYVKNVAK